MMQPPRLRLLCTLGHRRLMCIIYCTKLFQVCSWQGTRRRIFMFGTDFFVVAPALCVSCEECGWMQTVQILFWRNSNTQRRPRKNAIYSECEMWKRETENDEKRGESLKIRPIIRVSSFSMPIDFVPVLEWTKFLIYVIVHLVEWHNATWFIAFERDVTRLARHFSLG